MECSARYNQYYHQHLFLGLSTCSHLFTSLDLQLALHHHWGSFPWYRFLSIWKKNQKLNGRLFLCEKSDHQPSAKQPGDSLGVGITKTVVFADNISKNHCFSYYLRLSTGIFETVHLSLGLATWNWTMEIASVGQRTTHRPQRIHFSSSIIMSAPPCQV